jgi:hypothetical protein
VERQAEVGLDAGVLPIRRVRPDFRDEVEQVLAFSRSALLDNPDPEAKNDIPGHGQDEAEPFLSFESSNVNIPPGIENLCPGREGRDSHDEQEKNKEIKSQPSSEVMGFPVVASGEVLHFSAAAFSIKISFLIYGKSADKSTPPRSRHRSRRCKPDFLAQARAS